MEFKRLLNKVHDKVSHGNLPVNSPTPTRQRSFKDKKHTTLTRWRDKWGDVPRPRFFSNLNKSNDISNSNHHHHHHHHSNSNNNNTRENICSSSCYTSSPLPLPQIPTITLSSPTILKRSQSTITPRPPPPVVLTPSSSRRLPPKRKPRPISYTPRQTQRLSVPHVIDHLRSPYDPSTSAINTTVTTTTTSPVDDFDNENNNNRSDDDNDTGSFYKVPIRYSAAPSPSRQVTWYIPTRKSSLDDTTDSSMENDSVASMMSTHLKSSMSSSSSSSIHGLMLKKDAHRIEGDSCFPWTRQGSTFFENEIIQPHKESNNDIDDDDDDNDNDNRPILINSDTNPTSVSHHTGNEAVTDGLKGNKDRYSQLATLNVSNTMMMMREHQLELQMTRLRIDNQRLQQQVDDMVSGTWSSTTQLLAENDRLELQIQQLQKQQRLVRSSITGKGDLRWKDEQEALRHTRAQLGLVEYLEGEPDIIAALNRFKKLLTTSC